MMEASLGKLLRFDGGKKPNTAATQVRGDAQILIFTGVRYERGTPPPPKTQFEPKRGKRKRV